MGLSLCALRLQRENKIQVFPRTEHKQCKKIKIKTTQDRTEIDEIK